MKRIWLAAACVALASAAAVSFGVVGGQDAEAQTRPQQKVNPAPTRYWMGATTGAGVMAMSGFGAGGEPSMGDLMRMGMSGPPDAGRTVELRFGSALATTGAPEAAHTLPPGAGATRAVTLINPPSERVPTGPRERPTEMPKGTIKFYWGCGEKAGPGQPIVLTADKLMSGENWEQLERMGASVDAREVPKPTEQNSKTFAFYPNADKRNERLGRLFQTGPSLAGEHRITSSTAAPEIKFNLANGFMDPVRYQGTGKLPSGAVNVSWGAVNRATGYSLGVIGGRDMGNQGGEVVMWSSANRPSTFVVMDDIAPAEAQRLIGLKAILPPTQTQCAVPAEVVAATKEGSMLMFSAFGNQETFVFPPRPEDPKITWDQQWFTRVNFKSVRMDMIGPDGVTDMGAMMAGGGQRGARGGQMGASSPQGRPQGMSQAEFCKMKEEELRGGPSAAETVGGALGIPGGGMLGRALGGRKQVDKSQLPPECR